jgi:hypothetical protein
MIDFFSNYSLQREELLARIAHELQLDQSRIERMERAYNAVYELIKKDDVFFHDLDIEIYAQGSKRIGTTVKPINGNDFDLDTVLHIHSLYSKFNPSQIYNALVKVIEEDDYYKSIREKKDRCIRLNYKGDFHMDILPGCMLEYNDKEKIAIPEKKLSGWSSGNPKGFANWFLEIANSVEEPILKAFSESILKANVESEPLPNDNIYEKTPLQRAVQLVKRYRDIYYQDKEFPVSSIVLTTLMGNYYQGDNSIYTTIDNCIVKLKKEYNNAVINRIKFKITNPVNSDEEFTDSWTDKHYTSFFNFINDLYSKWDSLKNEFETSSKEYVRLFGEGVYKKSLQDQIKALSKFSSDNNTKSSAFILSNNALTDSKGQINIKKGVENEPHHNFGE